MSNNSQRFIILSGSIIIGTDSGQAFTEGAANQKCALLKQARPKQEFEVKEITPLLVALAS